MSKAKLGRVPQIPTADMEDDPIFTAVREYQQAGPGEYSATRIAGLQKFVSTFSGSKKGFVSVWAAAVGGDDSSLFELLACFKQFAAAGWVLRRLRKACKRHDREWMRKFGEALAAERHSSEDVVLNTLLAVGWWDGPNPFRKMKTDQIISELRKRGFPGRGRITEKEKVNLRQRLNRLGLKKREAQKPE